MFERNNNISDIIAEQNKNATIRKRYSHKATFTDRIIILLNLFLVATILSYLLPYKNLYCNRKTNTCLLSVRHFYELSAKPILTFKADKLLTAKIEGTLQNQQEEDDAKYSYTISLQTTEETITLFDASNSYLITKYKVDKINSFIKNKNEDLSVSDNVVLVWLPLLFLLFMLLVIRSKEITISYYHFWKNNKQ